jgi:ATP diphosphatase
MSVTPVPNPPVLSPLERLLDIMGCLRHPTTGCAWDLEQTYATIAPYTIEEAYEVADAIARDDMTALREELGDLLMQVVFHAQMAREEGLFSFQDVAETVADKMVARHPHVFGDAEVRTAAAVAERWEKLKEKERATKGDTSALAGVALGLPALMRAYKLQSRAARVGFDWETPAQVYAKLSEEMGELNMALQAGAPDAIEDEIGDLLFSVVNLARHLNVDPEVALRRSNAKFERRFHHVETRLAAQGQSPKTATLAQMDALWNEAKAEEPGRGESP